MNIKRTITHKSVKDVNWNKSYDHHNTNRLSQYNVLMLLSIENNEIGNAIFLIRNLIQTLRTSRRYTESSNSISWHLVGRIPCFLRAIFPQNSDIFPNLHPGMGYYHSVSFSPVFTPGLISVVSDSLHFPVNRTFRSPDSITTFFKGIPNLLVQVRGRFGVWNHS